MPANNDDNDDKLPWETVPPPDITPDQPRNGVDPTATAAAIAKDHQQAKPRKPNKGWANITPGGKDRYTREERQRALQQVYDLMVEQGYSKTKALQAVADDLGLRSPRTIDFWAQDFGYQFPTTVQARQQTDAARTQAHAISVYDQNKRLALSDMLFTALAKAAEVQLAAPVPDSEVLRNLIWANGVLVDKRRLEEGKPTSHDLQEHRDADQLLEAGKERLRVMRGGNTTPAPQAAQASGTNG